MSQELARVWPLIEAGILRIVPAPPIPEPKRPTGREIIAEVAAKHNISVRDLLSPSHRRAVAWPRQEAMYEMRQRTKLSLPQIARLLERDHTTILHGIKAHKARLICQ